MTRFAGLDRAYGTYNLARVQTREDGKKNGEAVTKREAVTEELWQSHLAGKEPGIGIIPIRDGNDCVFGAIDIDVYDGLSHTAILKKLRDAKIPLIVCRSKSGGAHLYLFCSEPTPASVVRGKLSEIAGLLGYGNCEVYPKQTQILSEKGDIGQWINMPYFGGQRTMRYAITEDGNALSPEDFLLVADKLQVEKTWFDEKLVIAQDFADGPPCLQALSQEGYPPGTRNNGLYNIGVYMKMAHPDDWETELAAANQRFMLPPLPPNEVQSSITRSLNKKDYHYKCKDEPICRFCNATLCRTRKYGVGGAGTGRFPLLGGLTKLDTNPPIWFWTVDGIRMELTTNELQDPRAFQRKCMDVLNMMPALPKLDVWNAAVQQAMDSVSVVEAPADSSPEGLFWSHVEKFCTGRAQARELEEIVTGKPHTSDKRTFFRLQDLLAYLKIQRFDDLRQNKITSLLKDAGAKHHEKNLRGRFTNYWSIPEYTKQTEGFSVPKDIQGEQDAF